MKLFFREEGTGKPVIILHGLMGCSDNWHSMAKELSARYRMILPDLRNHGKSPHSDRFDFESMAEDVAGLIEKLNLKNAVIAGHSLGGKIAMQLSGVHPELIEKLIIVDIGPFNYSSRHDIIFQSLNAVNFELHTTRKAVEKILAEKISHARIRQFLMKNLYWKSKGKLGWKMNLEAIQKNYSGINAAIEFDSPVNIPALFILAENSEYVAEKDIQELRKIFPLSEFETVKDADHWVHADQPGIVKNLFLKFIG